jgi:hypothetical protein
MRIAIAPRTAGVVNADRFVGFVIAVEKLRSVQTDLTERNTEIRMHGAGHIDLARRRKSIGAMRFERFFRRNHNVIEIAPGKTGRRDLDSVPSPALPGAGSTGLLHTNAELSAVCPHPVGADWLAPLLKKRQWPPTGVVSRTAPATRSTVWKWAQ